MCDNSADMVNCPFNPEHRMMRKRLQQHILKCRLYYPDIELHPCPFNKIHLHKEEELQHHIKTCPDRKLIEHYKYSAAPLKPDDMQQCKIECDENWDDADNEDYEPKKVIENLNVLREPDSYFRSERKAFIKKECERLGDAISDEEYVPATGNNQRKRTVNNFDRHISQKKKK